MNMRSPRRWAVLLTRAGTIATACVVVLGMGCERSSQSVRKADAGAAGNMGSGGVTVNSDTAGSGGSGGACGAACSGGATSILLSDPYADCGNGRRDSNEECDDGNRLFDDGCDNFCRVETHWTCPAWGKPCVPLCGNGVVDPDENCDDGNRRSDDGCSADCQKIETGWHCRVPGKACSPVCGDGIMLWNETCDDGNDRGGDGCSRACQVEVGYLCPEVGNPCERAPCVDAGVDAGVPCVGGPLPVPICGDGIVSGDEECDDGSDPNQHPHNDDNAYGGCTTTCRLGPYCGDGITNGPEICDDGDANLPSYGRPGCSYACKKTRYCGDGIIESYRGEMCEPFPGDQACMANCVAWIH